MHARAGFSLALKQEKSTRAKDCKSVFEKDLTFKSLVAIFDLDRALKNDLLFIVDLA